MYNEEIRDYGFEEPDRQFLMMTTDGQRIDLLKEYSWFHNMDIDEMDYEVLWKLQVNGKNYHIQEKHDRDKLIQIALILFEEDTEATDEINQHLQEMIHEQKMLGEY
ncbi:MAG: hypothetical protein ACJ71H_05005 [Nitrososphaeraceae archaeon]